MNSKEKISNTKAYNNPSDDPVFRTRQSVQSKEDKYDPTKYSVHYNTLNEPTEDPLASIKHKERSTAEPQIAQKSSHERFSERQVKSSQSHVKFKIHEQAADTFSEGFGNKTIRENSELQITVDFKENKGLLSVKIIKNYYFYILFKS